jgi:hypothetical protein
MLAGWPDGRNSGRLAGWPYAGRMAGWPWGLTAGHTVTGRDGQKPATSPSCQPSSKKQGDQNIPNFQISIPKSRGSLSIGQYQAHSMLSLSLSLSSIHGFSHQILLTFSDSTSIVHSTSTFTVDTLYSPQNSTTSVGRTRARETLKLSVLIPLIPGSVPNTESNRVS